MGRFTLIVDVPEEFKATQMSRFLEVLSNHNHDISPETIPDILLRLRERLRRRPPTWAFRSPTSARWRHPQPARLCPRVTVRPGKKLLWIECIVDLIESAASAPLYPLLKRPDAKFVTEQAYNNPRFVEDMVREVSPAFDNEDRILS